MRSIILLAMNRNCASDISRTSQVAEFGTVVTVSESDVMNRGEHLAVDFYTPRGWRRVVQLVREHRLVADEVVVIMDYFFLLDSYWRERYNLDWLTYKVPALLAAGATRVILPRTNAMLIMESQATLFGVPVGESEKPPVGGNGKIGCVRRARGERDPHKPIAGIRPVHGILWLSTLGWRPGRVCVGNISQSFSGEILLPQTKEKGGALLPNLVAKRECDMGTKMVPKHPRQEISGRDA
jgi:hypothetical protein